MVSLLLLYGTYLAYTGPILTNINVYPNTSEGADNNSIEISTAVDNQVENVSLSGPGCRRNLTTQERLAKEDPYGDTTHENKLFFLLFFLTIWILARCIASLFQQRLRTPQTKETAIYV